MWIEIVGWLGMVLLLAVFFLASHRYLDDTRCLYHLINILGACGVMINAFSKGVLSVGFVEIAWSIIALVGIFNAYKHLRRAA
ncbi:MAG: hypothetical protein HY877_00590 [Deltaproteobacteria bacterium]|nr:hypothetical protein [Deltaproteobacteria bacterium]